METVTDGWTILDDALAFDIFSQAAQAIREPPTSRWSRTCRYGSCGMQTGTWRKVIEATHAARRAGYIVGHDAAETISAAARSDTGRR